MKKIDELKLEELRNQLKESNIYLDEFRNEEIPSFLTKYIEDYPIEMIFLLCEACCQVEGISYNPFQKIFESMRYQKYCPLASIILNGIYACDEDDINKKEYITLIQYVGREFNLNANDIFQAKKKCGSDEFYPLRFSKLIRYLFDELEDRIKDLFFHLCWMIYRGLPIYQKSGTDKFSIVSDSNHDYIYLFMNGLYQTCPGRKEIYDRNIVSRSLTRYFSIPDWSLNYYLKNDQLIFFKEYCSKNEYVFDDQQTISLRRAAFRNAIGESDVFIAKQSISESSLNNDTKQHGTKLMRIQRKVIERFYGNQFNINDRDTWTKQNTVVDWLMKEHGLSDREAKAIDMITRPDIARGK